MSAGAILRLESLKGVGHSQAHVRAIDLQHSAR